MSVPNGFWTMQLNDNLADSFGHLLNYQWLNQGVPNESLNNSEFPVLLPSTQIELVAESQMFFEEPWFNIDYEDREAETAKLYNEYRQAVATQLGGEGIDMDELFELNRQTMYDEFPDAWDSPVAYELGERVHLWTTPDQTWFLSIFQEDKELPIEIHFGRFNNKDMQALTYHMSAFATNQKS